MEGVAVAGATAPPKAMPETRLIKIAEKIESVDLRKLGQGGKTSDKSPAPADKNPLSARGSETMSEKSANKKFPGKSGFSK